MLKKYIKKEKSPAFKATLIYLIILSTFVLLRILAQFDIFYFLDSDLENLVYSLIIQVGIIFGLTLFCTKKFFKKSTKQIFKDFKFKKISFKAVLLCIGIGFCLIVLNTFFSTFYSYILELLGYHPVTSTITSYTVPALLLALFASAFLPGFCEEFANRGMLLNGLRGLGAKKAIVISGLLFALMHLNISQFGFTFLVGMFFAYLVFKTGSIIPGMIVHFMNNALSEFSTFAQVNGLPFGSITSEINALLQGGDLLSATLVFFLVIITVTFLFIWLTHLLVKDTRKDKIKEISHDIIETTIEAENEKAQNDPNYIPQAQYITISMTEKDLDEEFPQKVTLTLRQKIPLIMCICLGSIITLMTFIWNVI